MGLRYEPRRPLDGEFPVVWFEYRPATGVVIGVERPGGGPVLGVWFDDAIAFRRHRTTS